MSNHTSPPDAGTTLELSSHTDYSVTAVGDRRDEQAGRRFDLYVVTVDVQGRLPLRRVAAAAGWRAGDALGLVAGDAVLRLEAGRTGSAVVEVKLDARLRVQLPYHVWVDSDFRPGARLRVVVALADGLAVAAPVATVLAHLLGRR